MATRLRSRFSEAPVGLELMDAAAAAATPLAGWNDLDPLVDRIGEARIVLLGEASHGTAEYYDWRRLGNYMPTVLPRRYDAVAFFDHTRALHPLNVPASFEHEAPETYPSGV